VQNFQRQNYCLALEPLLMEPLTVAGTLDSLGAIAQYVLAAAAAAGLDKKASYKLRLAADEIATNIIIHGYQEAGRSGELICHATFDEQVLTICIEDTGIPYDPTEKPDPDDLNKPLEERRIGGLGVYLAIQSVDLLLYERVGNRNRNILVMNPKPNIARG
jgi:anti-sigma regulatory factor (Ser/Thr protein kinase)